MLSEKRMVEGYEITQAFEIGKSEIILGENPNAPDNMIYLVASCEHNGIFTRYNDVLIGDDFAELAKIFAERIAAEKEAVIAASPFFSSVHTLLSRAPLYSVSCSVS